MAVIFSFGYLLVCLWLAIGLTASGSKDGLILLSIHLIFFVLGWILTYRTLKKYPNLSSNPLPAPKLPPNWLGWLACATLISVAVIHWSALNSVPLFGAATSSNLDDALLHRQNATENASPALNYFYALFTGGVLPVVCLMLLIARDRLAFVFFCLAVFYVASMLQKAPPILVSIPALIYVATNREWRKLIRFVFVPLLAVVLVHFSLNASFHKLSWINQNLEKSSEISQDSKKLLEINQDLEHNKDFFTRSARNFLDRALFVPGRTGAIWVQLIPSQIPFSHGCSYRPLAALLGCDFINTSVLIHQLVEPELNKRGIRGTMNAAEMFNGYANFGLAGAAGTGLFMSWMMSFIGWVYRNWQRFGLAVSAPFILMQSSVGLPVTLLSGGWLLSITLFFYLRRYLPSDRF